jgi:PAS domain S-box-containing protein
MNQKNKAALKGETFDYRAAINDSLRGLSIVLREHHLGDPLNGFDKIPVQDEVKELVAGIQDIVRGYQEMVREKDEIISRLETAEKSVKKERDRAQEYLDIAGIMIVKLDSEGRVALINQKGCKILGFNREEIIGKSWFDSFLPERIRQETKFVYQNLMRGDNAPFEYFENSVLTATGEERTIAWHNTILRDDAGDPKGTLSSGEDITDRIHMEHALRGSEERFRTIFETTGVSIWEEDFTEVKSSLDELRSQGIKDLRQYLVENPEFVQEAAQKIKVVDVNPATLKMFGAETKEELLGALKSVFVPETTDILINEMIAIAEEQTYFEGETINQTLQGDRLNVLLTMSIPSDPKKLNSILVSMMDITERAKAEKALRKSLDETAHNRRLLLALSHVAQSVQRARTTEEVFETISEKAVELGFDVTIFNLSEDRHHLILSHNTQKPEAIRAAENLLGLNVEKLSIPLKPEGFLQRIIDSGNTVFGKIDRSHVEEILPGHLYPFVGRLTRLIEKKNNIIAPMVINDQVMGLLFVMGPDLSESDMPAINAFANQASIAIENARLYDETQQLATFNERIIHGMAEGIVVVDTDGFFNFVNPTAADMLGYSVDEMLRLNTEEVVPADQFHIVQEADQRRIQGESDQYELELRCKNGTRISVLVSGTPIYSTDGDFTGTMAVFTDITDRKKAEKTLRESEERYRSLFDSVPVGIYNSTPDGRFLDGNPALMEMLGFPDYETMMAADIRDLYIERGDREEELNTLEQEGSLTNYRIQLRRYDGKIIWGQDTVNVVHDKSGEILHYYGRLEDITEHIEAEEALKQSEQKFRTLAEESPNVIFINKNGRIVYANEKSEEIMGYKREEFYSSDFDFLSLIAPESIPTVKSAFSTHMRGKDVEPYEYVLFTKDSRRIEAINTAKLIDYEGEPAILGIVTDISEQKQVEMEIRAYTDRIEALLEIERAITSTLDLNEVLTIIMGGLKKVIPYDSISLQILTDKHLEIIASSGFNPEDNILGMTLPLEAKYPNYLVVTSQESLAIKDVVQEYPHFKNQAGQYTSGHVRSWLGVPLIYKDTVKGMIALNRAEVNPFSDSEIQIATAFASQAALAIENARLFSEANQRLNRLGSLRNIDQAITASFDLKITLRIILDQVVEQLQVDAAVVLLYQKELQTLEFSVERGFRTKALRHTNLRLGQGTAGIAALEKRIINIPDLNRGDTGFLRSPHIKEEQFVAYYGAPLIAKGELVGVLEIFHRSPLNPDLEWIDFLETLARQAAIAVDSVRVFNDLQRSNIDLIRAYDSTIEGWARALEMRDMETEGHSRRVVDLTLQLARMMGMMGKELANVRRGALLHDIGKMAIPDSILQKTGSLSEEEWEVMRQHPVYAYDWLSSIDFLRTALDIPFCHHEKWDGTGYPRGLQGNQIPLAARIFAVVDVWEALTSDRPYRKAWTEEKALSYIQENSGSHFDPEIVKVFNALLASYD